jgi:hypothetical protein
VLDHPVLGKNIPDVFAGRGMSSQGTPFNGIVLVIREEESN